MAGRYKIIKWPEKRRNSALNQEELSVSREAVLFVRMYKPAKVFTVPILTDGTGCLIKFLGPGSSKCPLGVEQPAGERHGSWDEFLFYFF